MKCVIFTVLLIIAVAIAAPAPEEENEKQLECSPWGGKCSASDQCCRHLMCATYAAKCVPRGVLVIPGGDKRPLGPGPYPPNVPSYELP